MTLRSTHLNVAGLRAAMDAIGVARDNLAQFPAQTNRQGFQDALNRNGAEPANTAQARSANLRVGSPVGPLVHTSVATELGIRGDGYLAVAGDVAGTPGTFFTRSGQFRSAGNGTLVTAANLALLGRPVLPDGTLADSVAPLTIPKAGVPARSTTRLALVANLEASEPLRRFDLAAAAATPAVSGKVDVFDSLGRPHALQLHCNRVGDGQWQYHATLDAAELAAVGVGSEVEGGSAEVGNGSLHFSREGLLEQVVSQRPIAVVFGGGAAPQSIELDFGDPLAVGGSGMLGTTQFSMPSALGRVSQDGYSAGATSGIKVQPDGTIEGAFSNGQSRPLGQVVLAQFRLNEGLAQAGDGLFAQTQASGQAVLGAPGRGGRGTLVAETPDSETLEAASEPTNGVRPERVPATSAQVLATADDLLASLRFRFG
jgi:flagellar hook protein FlgE